MESWNAPSSWAGEQRRRHAFAEDGTPCAAQSHIDGFVASLRACTKQNDLDGGTHVHNELLHMGLVESCSDALVTMYAKCGAIAKAKALLDIHNSRDVITWTALIAAYARDGQGQNALDCFERMRHEDILPDAVTYSCILKACASIDAIDKGKEIHDEIARQGLLQKNVVLGGALVDMYAKCGSLSMARSVLEELPSQNVACWNALIAGFAQQGQAEQALNCFEQMQRECGILPNAVTYACILKACATIGAIDKGKEIHEEIARQGLLHDNIVLGGALVDMYAKCGALSVAEDVLEKLPSRNVVSWSALIAGYAEEGQVEKALDCFKRMQGEGILPNAVTYISLLKSCASIHAVDVGKEIHDQIERQGLLQSNIVLGGALVDLYAKCGDLSTAQCVLEELPFRNVVVWNALIAGYANESQAEQALNCFEQMQNEGLLPGAVTYACILKACATIEAIDKGKKIHDEIARQGLLQSNIVLRGALVDMYAKCGALSIAQRVLERLPSRDVAAWNALIAGYAQEGQAEQALNCFEQMQHEGIVPNAVTFSCVLNVCSHLGLVEEGQALFMNMSTKYGMKPDLESYTCMVDLYGRAGHLEKAVRLIQEMPYSDYLEVWLALLSACRKWGDVQVGKWAFEWAKRLDVWDGPAYILMADIYAAAGLQEKARNINAIRIRNETWKKPDHSWWVDAHTVALAFSTEDTKHGQSTRVHAKVEHITRELLRQGYSRGLCHVSRNISCTANMQRLLVS